MGRTMFPDQPGRLWIGQMPPSPTDSVLEERRIGSLLQDLRLEIRLQKGGMADGKAFYQGITDSSQIRKNAHTNALSTNQKAVGIRGVMELLKGKDLQVFHHKGLARFKMSRQMGIEQQSGMASCQLADVHGQLMPFGKLNHPPNMIPMFMRNHQGLHRIHA